MRRIRFIVVGPPPFLMPAVRHAWAQVGIDLQGPYNTVEFASRVIEADADGAIIDVHYDAPTLLSVVEVLDAFAIPALFAGGRASPVGGFVLSADPGTINAIVRHLMGSEEKTIQ